MKTKKMLLVFTILLLLVLPATTVQARKVQKKSVNVEHVSQLTWPELKRSVLGIPDRVEGFRCCQIANGLVYQLKKLELNQDLKIYEKVYQGGDLEVEIPICESIVEAFEKDTGVKVIYFTKHEEGSRIRLRVMRLEVITGSDENRI